MRQHKHHNQIWRIATKRLGMCVGIVAATLTMAVQAGDIIQVRREITVARNNLQLKDLLKNTADLAEEKAKKTVMEMPPVGEEKRVALVDLAYKLQRFPDLLDRKLRGPKTVVIKRKVNWAEVSDSIKQVKEAIREKQQWQDWTIKIDFDQNDHRRISKLTGKRFRVRVAEKDQILGEVPIQVTAVGVQDHKKGQERLTPVIQRQIQGLVLTKRKGRGSTLRASDVKTVDLWIKDNNQDICTDVGQAVGRELRRSLGEGDMVKEKHLAAPLYAENGDLVVVQCEHENLQVRVNVRALESGRKGERVRVRNPESNKVFSVKLTGKRQAELDF